MDCAKTRNSNEPEFLLAVHEVAETIAGFVKISDAMLDQGVVYLNLKLENRKRLLASLFLIASFFVWDFQTSYYCSNLQK